MSKIIGWDIGGAHLKAAMFEDDKLLHVIQLPCELWRGLDKLEASIKNVLEALNARNNTVRHAVTMTGELVDLFPNRHSGVMEIAGLVSRLLGEQAMFYAANNGFVGINSVLTHAEAIASANWHASASLLAKYVPDALLIDIGSTTTDIIPIAGGKVSNIGCSDALRMREDTLLYTGVVRTPVMALAQKLPFENAETNVAAEYFATMADIYRLTADLRAELDMAETADGKGKSALESARRLARMVGHDLEDKPLATWVELAQTCKELQLNQIKMAALKHLRPNTPIIGAGTGAFLVKALANKLNCRYMTVAETLKMELNDTLSVSFPAYAVAHLVLKST